MGCGAVTSAKYLPTQALTDAKPSSKSSASNIPAPTLAPETISGTDAAGGEAETTQAEDVRHSPKRSRVGKAVRSAQKWSRAEVEQLTVAQLCKWLEALERDYSSAVSREKAIARLWQEIEAQRPPALASVQSLEDLNWWPLQETLSWLAYFGADTEVADKETLIQLLLANEEELPPPAFLGESAEDAYLTQVQRHVGLVKTAATGLLRELANEITELETQQRKEEQDKHYEHPWTGNGKVLVPFGKSEIQTLTPLKGSEGDPGNENDQQHFLEAAVGEHVDVMFHDPSGWAWCTTSARRGSQTGWIPSGSLVEVAQVLEGHSSAGNDGTLSVQQNEEVEVLLRHYSGWTLTRHAQSLNEAQALKSPTPEGWVPDACLSDHPRSLKTKQHRLILNGLHRLAEDAYAVEAAFFKLRTRAEGGEDQNDAEDDPPLSVLYAQVLQLIDEYRSICEVVQAHAASGTIGSDTNRHSEVTEEAPTGRGSIPGLPDWIYLGAPCLWNSKSQGWMMPVTVRKISEQRQKVLVVFDDAPTACKHVPFSAFEDMSTCLLQPASKENSRKRKRKHKSERERRRKEKEGALAAQSAAEEALVDDLQSLVNDLEDMQSAQGTARKHLMSDSSSSDSEASVSSSTTTAVSASRPESGTLSAEASDPSGQQSARFGGAAGTGPAATAAPKADTEPSQEEEEALKEAAAPIEAIDGEAAAPPSDQLIREAAALRIQCAFRAQPAWKEAVHRLAARACRDYIAAAEEAVANIHRAREAREAQRREVERRQAAAVKIQGEYRDSRRRAQEAAEAAAAAAVAAAAAEAARIAAIKEVQGAARNWLCRRELNELSKRNSALNLIQRTIRTWAPRSLLAGYREEWHAERTTAAIHIERMARGWHARREARSRRAEREEALKVASEASAMCKIQGACKGFLIRVMMHDLQLKWASAVRIQARARGGLTRQRYGAELAEFTSRRVTAAVVIESTWRGLQAKRLVSERRRLFTSGAVKVQCAWRSYKARETMARLREERAAEEARKRREELERTAAVKAQAAWRGLRTRRRTKMQLQQRFEAAAVIQSRTRKFLAWREASRFDANRLAASAARDRARAALAAARARAELRAKALRVGQAGAGTALSLLKQGAAECDAAMIAALRVDEGLLARLAVSDAVAEVASVISTAWELTVGAGPGGSSTAALRSAGMKEALPVLQSSITAIVRRLAPEAGPADTATRQPGEETDEAVAAAEEHVGKLREATLAPLRTELQAICQEGPEIVKAVKEAMAKVPIEVQALRAKHDSQTEEAARDLRAERERKHEQTCALHNIALNTQIQKERLETSLMDSSKGPRVYDSVLANVKKLKTQLQDLEVSGTSNRKNQGILGHTLRILEVRANKAAGERRTADAQFAQRAEDYVGDYKESEQVRKKRLRQEEQDRAFHKALETELTTLRADLDAKATWECSALGAKLRGEAEELGKTAVEIAERLKQWRQAASQARPWLGTLPPLARSNVTVAALASWLQSQASEEDRLASAVAGALPCMEALRRQVSKAGPADSPRENKVGNIATSLSDVRTEVGKLRVAYPDPIGPPPGGASTDAVGDRGSPLSEELETSPEASPDRDQEDIAARPSQASRQSRAKRAPTGALTARLDDECATPRLDEASPEARPETVWEEPVSPKPAAAQAKKKPNKIMEQAAAGLASLGHELNGLSESLASAAPVPKQRPLSAAGRRNRQPLGTAPTSNSSDKVSTPARRPPSAAALRRSPPPGAPAGNAMSAVKESRRTHTAWN